ncbi:hypothetical protein PO909_002798 [Leuciscus waleckii]
MVTKLESSTKKQHKISPYNSGAINRPKSYVSYIPFDDEILKSLFWIWGNYHHPIDLWSVYPWSRTQLDPEPVSPSANMGELCEPPPADRATTRCDVLAGPEDKLTFFLEEEPPSESDQGCEPTTSVAEGKLVEIETEDWLIDFSTETAQWTILPSISVTYLLTHSSSCDVKQHPSHLWLQQTPSAFRLHRVPSSHRLPLGQSSRHLCQGLEDLPLRFVPPPPMAAAGTSFPSGTSRSSTTPASPQSSGTLASPQTLVAAA